MKLFLKSLLVSAAALTFAPTSALALLPDCDLVCFAPASCSGKCTNPWSTSRLTCGQFVEYYGNSFPENSCVQPAGIAPESACDAAMEDSEEGDEAVCLEPAQPEER